MIHEKFDVERAIESIKRASHAKRMTAQLQRDLYGDIAQVIANATEGQVKLQLPGNIIIVREPAAQLRKAG
ncbi:hypothetical protein [Caballeronia zhejiangensis]|uniref:Uncharacterized protein n=1 Tax=Caballeronia zhejiangensis TaxID=871203 RepID=A0A656QAJ5_9BURK|nr:hypothetical protein [Caballeronia zhejiangensis]KDR25999.1 hypothetical protein BG60_26415 [Caballeronia zhejiangensis]